MDEENDDWSLFQYGFVNEKRLKVSLDNWMDIWSWRDWVKTPYWFKIKPIYKNNNKNYESYGIYINGKHCVLSRVLYKLYNKNWDITDISSDNKIDHINNNSFDNRIENLRILTHQQNLCNNDARGTHFDKRIGKWRAQLSCNGKLYYGKYKDTEPEAYQDRLLLKEKYHIMPE